ncbi:hypothetical protein LOK49_LG01G01369 [Camellia lanceoleosa]|uniref:Uncharacterized protein n=1 Tax=Camellia lanceoleosa TaxID=1840588 RepID=A0ACC0J5M1_9ERIC|nr:hypothetical protein LOK49_LG01G01369 [Camellia lanceoleosa]
MGDEPTDIGDDPGDEPIDMGDYEDQQVDTTAKVNEDLIGPFLGGTYDPSILKSFQCHIAAKIWHNDGKKTQALNNWVRIQQDQEKSFSFFEFSEL